MPVPDRKTNCPTNLVANAAASKLSPMVPDLPSTEPVRVPVPCSTVFPEEKTTSLSWTVTVPVIAPEKVTTRFRVRIVFPSAIRALVVVMETSAMVPVPVVGVAACAIGSKSKAMGRRNNALAIFIFFTLGIFGAHSRSVLNNAGISGLKFPPW